MDEAVAAMILINDHLKESPGILGIRSWIQPGPCPACDRRAADAPWCGACATFHDKTLCEDLHSSSEYSSSDDEVEEVKDAKDKDKDKRKDPPKVVKPKAEPNKAKQETKPPHKKAPSSPKKPATAAAASSTDALPPPEPKKPCVEVGRRERAAHPSDLPPEREVEQRGNPAPNLIRNCSERR